MVCGEVRKDRTKTEKFGMWKGTLHVAPKKLYLDEVPRIGEWWGQDQEEGPGESVSWVEFYLGKMKGVSGSPALWSHL